MSVERLVEKMRGDWAVVAEDKRARGEWSRVDEDEVGALVKEVVAGGDVSLMTAWALWLSELAGAILLLRLVARGVDGRIRAAVAEARLAKERTGAA